MRIRSLSLAFGFVFVVTACYHLHACIVGCKEVQASRLGTGCCPCYAFDNGFKQCLEP
jgi:hypothetical protein